MDKALCDKIEDFGKGIGNSNRYRILEALNRGPRTVSQIVKAVKMSQPSVSHHLKTLKASNLVSDRRQGQEVLYLINLRHTLDLLKIFGAHLNLKRKKHYGLHPTSVSRARSKNH